MAIKGLTQRVHVMCYHGNCLPVAARGSTSPLPEEQNSLPSMLFPDPVTIETLSNARRMPIDLSLSHSGLVELVLVNGNVGIMLV